MTEKRFGIIKNKTYGLYVPVDKMGFYNFSSFESELDCIRVVNALNDLEEKSRENGKLASKYLEENDQLKQEVTHWKKILDNHQQIVAKTLREQYHWLKNEDKISNHDKTVALLELEAISNRLGIDLI